MWVAVDAMSAEQGYETVMAGTAMAVRELGAKVILVGDENVMARLLQSYPDIRPNVRLVHTDQVVTMQEHPAMAVKTKKNASVNICARLVRDSEAVGFFSPGNTGATMAAALSNLGRLPGVKRPAIATPIPREDGRANVLLDAGANVDCKSEYLVQFAIMGEVYAREILGVINPKIGLLSNGEEEIKGNEQTLEAFQKLKKLPYDFVGNVEGRDLFGTGKPVDVIVCDGFIGNIVLKSLEGLAKTIFNILRTNIKASPLATAGALMLKPAFMAVKNRMDYASYGGAPLLGVAGITVIGHGSSNAWAIRNAIRVTLEFAKNDVLFRIQENIRRYG
ncbi:MAG: phosphate acyltransferase PlsX [Leptospiraceae bacterium]|nr:phosphate acyltransferase PlsX [Leptospiraceae bacterium]MDW8306277.1 phosphate acyltransferase PlsX [Leptospiraceae bacterium]